MEIFLNVLIFIAILTGQTLLPSLFSRIRSQTATMWTAVLFLYSMTALLWIVQAIPDTWLWNGNAFMAITASFFIIWNTSLKWHKRWMIMITREIIPEGIVAVKVELLTTRVETPREQEDQAEDHPNVIVVHENDRRTED